MKLYAVVTALRPLPVGVYSSEEKADEAAYKTGDKAYIVNARGAHLNKRTFYIRALWDDEARVFYSESDISGLHLEAPTIEEFEQAIDDLAIEMIVENHLSAEDLASKPLKDLVPAIL